MIKEHFELNKMEKTYAILLFRQGYTIQEIARMYGCNIIHIVKAIKK